MTATAPVAAPGPGADSAAPSNTAAALRRLRVVLVVGCVLVGALSSLVFAAGHDEIVRIGQRSGPAALQTSAAYGALVSAQQAAVHAVRTRTVALGGPGGDYQNDIAAVSQDLADLAGDNVAGPAGDDRIRTVEGLVVTYNAQVEQAAADGQQSLQAGMAVPDLWYATAVFNQAEQDLRTLASEEQAPVLAPDSLSWLHWHWLRRPAALLWLLPLVLLLGFFAATQLLVRRRFRRLLSVRLAAAALCVLAAGLLCGISQRALDQALTPAHRDFQTSVGLAAQQATLTGRAAEADLYALVTGFCPGTGHCGTGKRPATAPDPQQLQAQIVALRKRQDTSQTHFRSDIRAAADGGTVRLALIPGLAAAAAVLAGTGLRPRIDEYRFEGRT
jgi:hypothetical protein